MVVTNIVLNDLGANINTMLVNINVLYVVYASAHVWMRMWVKVP